MWWVFFYFKLNHINYIVMCAIFVIILVLFGFIYVYRCKTTFYKEVAAFEHQLKMKEYVIQKLKDNK